MTGSQEVRGSIPLVSTIEGIQPLVSRGCFLTGLLAQRLAQGTHNPWVEGSNPPGPTINHSQVTDLAFFIAVSLYRMLIGQKVCKNLHYQCR